MNDRWTRRQMLAASAAVVAARAAAAKPERRPLPVVDTHQHLWDLDKFTLPWLEDAPKVLRRSYVTKDYLAAIGQREVKAVYMEVDLAVAQQTREAEHVIALSRSSDHPTVGAVISGRPASQGFVQYMTPLAKNKEIKGVRQVLHADSAQRGLCLDAQFVRSMKWLGEHNLSFDLCMRPMELEDGAKLARQCPDTRFIVDHCGNADPKAFMKQPPADAELWHDADSWRRSIDRLAELSNVICKISGIVARAPEGWTPEHLTPIIDHCLDSFGPNRVVFGGDWPVCLLGGPWSKWLEALEQVIAHRPEPERRKLLHDNAVRFYSL